MRVKYEKKFLKDLESLDKNLSFKFRNLIFEIKFLTSFSEIKNTKKIIGYKNYYRIRFGDYRVGIKYFKNEIIFIRLKHRKDIYKFFPG